MTDDFRDLVSVVLEHAERTPERMCVRTFSRRAPSEERSVGQVAAAAGRAAAFFHEHGLRAGDVVVFLGTHHIDFYAAWLGCVWLGAIPTVLAEPGVRINKQVYWSRLAQLLERIGAWGTALDPRVNLDNEQFSAQHAYRYDAIAAGAGPVPPRVAPQPEETLLLQHSSGTTGLQKGVMLSHRAVWRHAVSYNDALRLTGRDVIATWLPLYHDMGFIACFVNALLMAAPVVWLSPFEWVANPALLLEAIAKHRATIAWLPNFAFAFLAQRVKAEPGRFDLSSLRALINCSEPVTAEAMGQFAERYREAGFQPAALQTCYAMAENVFAVSSSSEACPPRQLHLDRVIWQSEHRAVPVEPGAAGALVHVSNGKCVPDCELRIVDDAGRPLPPNAAGEVLIRSGFLFSGYFRRDDLNGGLFDADGFYNTGDVGYVDDAGHVYITGRKKDLIIVGGRNVYPQDVEQVVGEIPGVHPGRVVCFGVSLSSLGTEGLVVLVEGDEPASAWPEIERQSRRIVPARLDLDLIDARVLAAGSLRKSTSGKLARAGNREWYLAGKWGAAAAEVANES